MEILIKAAQFFLSISILVILHEFGHYGFAKLFKTRVEKFYLFFNPWFEIYKKKWGETEYGIGWLPLGGYVKISGMIDESMDKEQLARPAEEWEFRSKPTWQRLLIMLGGVMMNFILAFLIYMMIAFVWGDQYLPTQNVQYGVMCDSTALNMGLQNGDKILSLDNQPVENFNKIAINIVLNGHKTMQVERNGEIISLDIPQSVIAKLIKTRGFIAPRIPFIAGMIVPDSPAQKADIRVGDKLVGVNETPTVFFDEFKTELQKFKNQDITVFVERNEKIEQLTVHVPESGLIGISPNGQLSDFFELREIKYNLVEAVPVGLEKGYNGIADYLKQFKLFFSPETKAYESLGGFIAIGNLFSGTWNWQAFWFMTAMLSIMLGVLNLLPIPALDGGHVVFLLYEMVSGRQPNEKFLEYAQIAGMLLLLSLVIFANGNDVVKLFK